MRSTPVTKAARTTRSASSLGYQCGECGHPATKWHGRCPECQAWGTLLEAGPAKVALRRVSPGTVTTPAARIDQVSAELVGPRPSGLGELDRVLGGGLVPGGVVLLAGEPGVGKVRAVAAALTAAAKERDIACVLVGHVTKDGAIAGPRVLEHLVDVVLHFEGERHSSLRLIRGVKNRYGPSDEVGCFQMVPDGIVGLADPSGLFLSARGAPVPGTCATVTMQGRRALPVEVQSLIAPAGGEISRRTVSGLDSARTAMVLAVLQRWGGVALAGQDVLAATIGG